MDVLQRRRLNYEALATFDARANAALEDGDHDAHRVWASMYHALRGLLDQPTSIIADSGE